VSLDVSAVVNLHREGPPCVPSLRSSHAVARGRPVVGVPVGALAGLLAVERPESNFADGKTLSYPNPIGLPLPEPWPEP